MSVILRRMYLIESWDCDNYYNVLLLEIFWNKIFADFRKPFRCSNAMVGAAGKVPIDTGDSSFC